MQPAEASQVNPLISRILHTTFCLAVVMLLVVMLFLLVSQYLVDPTAFNSDNLLSSAQCDDLLHGRELTDWHLPGAPYLFPDLLLLAPCQALTPTLPAAFLAYCLALHLCIAAVLAWLGRKTGLSWRTAIRAAACGAILLVVLHLGHHDLHRCWLLVHPGSHLGAIFTGLLLLTLTVHWLQRPRSWLTVALYLVVGGLGIFSDNLVAAQFLAPLGLALLVLAARRVLPLRQAIVLVALLVTSFALSLLLKFCFRRLGFHLLEVEMSFGKLHLPDLFAMLRTLYHSVEAEHVLCALIPLYLLATLYLIRGRFRGVPSRPNESGFARCAILLASLTFVLSAPCILGILFVARMTHQPAIPRYTLSCWFLPPLLLPLLLCWLPGRIGRVTHGCVQAGILLFALQRAFVLLPDIDAKHFEQPYPPLAQALDKLARERGPMVGLGGFWLARSTSWFTREPIRVNAISPLGEPWFHASNPARFLADDRKALSIPSYRFVVLRHGDVFGPSPAVLTLQFGEPAEKILVGGDEIWLFDSLRTPPFDRFLRTRLATRLVHERSFAGPVEPACLARPKANMTPPDARDMIRVEAGQTCAVRFATRMYGSLLNLAASAEARLELEFYRGEEQLGRLPVPDVPWTGACYEKPGMQSRLLTLPATWRERGWDRIVIHAPANAATVALGHVLVFDESIPGLEEQVRPLPRPDRLRLEAEDMFPLNPGTPYTDEPQPQASGGRVRRAAVDFHCCFAYTPRLFLTPGRYRLECLLKVEVNTTAEVGTLIVSCVSTRAVLGESKIAGKETSAQGRWIKQQLTFEVHEDPQDVQIGIVSLGKAPLSADYFDLIAEPMVSSIGAK